MPSYAGRRPSPACSPSTEVRGAKRRTECIRSESLFIHLIGVSSLALFTYRVYSWDEMIRRVELSKLARKQLKKMPRHIVENLASWVDDVETRGMEEIRKILGYHDEPLHGDRQGQRSIRLSRDYRAIYVVKDDGEIEFVLVEEVSKHDY